MKAGDYVSVNKGVWDAEMPKCGRDDGIVLEAFGASSASLTEGGLPGQVTVLFHNGAILRFHKSQLTIIKSSEQFYL